MQMDKYIGRTDRLGDGETETWTEMERRRDGQTDEWMERWMDRE